MAGYQENFKSVGNNQYKVAISYRNIGQQREYIKAFYELLTQKFAEAEIFYDGSPTTLIDNTSVNRDLGFLANYYQSDIIFILYSKEYQAHPNCIKELTIARELINNPHLGERRVVLVRFDDSPFPEEYRELNKKIFIHKDQLSQEEVLTLMVDILDNRASGNSDSDDKFPKEYQFELQPNEFYQKLIEELGDLQNGGRENEHLVFSRSDLESKFDDLLKGSNFVFVEGPILTGKSILLNKFLNNYQEEYESVYPDPNTLLLLKQQNGLNKLEDCFYAWTKQFITYSIAKSGKLPNAQIENIGYRPGFDEKLKNLSQSSYPKNKIYTFLLLLNEIKVHFYKNKEVLVTLNLDDLQKYASMDIFNDLREEMNRFSVFKRNFSKIEPGIRIVLVTRYFPLQRPRGAILTIEDFSSEEIRNLFSPLFQSEAPSIENEIYDHVFEITKGHPWFCFRLFKIFLLKRIQGDERSPTSILYDLLDQPDYWFKDDWMEDGNEYGPSQFIRELAKLIFENEPSREFFLRFIGLEDGNQNGQGTVIVNNKDYTSNPILRQAGFIRLQEGSTSIYQSRMNRILKKYLKKELELYL